MNILRIVFASQDGKHFIDEHFGDSKYYYIYNISKNDSHFFKKIENTKLYDNEIHADPNKAKGITEDLKHLGVHVLTNKAFGRNIKRMSKNFVCIIMNHDSISEAILSIQQNFDKISDTWNYGEKRQHILLRK